MFFAEWFLLCEKLEKLDVILKHSPRKEEGKKEMSLQKRVVEIIKAVKEFKQQRGSILIISAMMLPIMLGCLGFAYDFGNLYMHKARLQNVVDAAALAGGRAYLQSQEKSDNRDEPDPRPDWTGNPNELLSYSVGDKITNDNNNKFKKVHGVGVSNHPDADLAADDYILNNIKNLGTTVNMDEFSHYALRAEGMSSKIFYRIGLYEQVPLHFLPVLINRRIQKVRAGAVVLVDDGKGIATGNTLFDKLFVVNDGISFKDDDGNSLVSQIFVDPENVGVNEIKTTFDGQIVYAKDAVDFKDFKDNYGQMVDYDFYTDAERNYNQEHSIDEIKKTPNMGGEAVWDNSILIESNISGFLKKLRRPHIDLKKNTIQETLNEFKFTGTNNYKNRDKMINSHYTITNSEEVTHYFHRDTLNSYNYFAFCIPRFDTEGTGTEGSATEKDYLGKAYIAKEKNKTVGPYFSFHTEGYNFKYFKKGVLQSTPRVCYTYVLDDAGNKIFCFRENQIKYSKQYYFWFYKKYFDQDTKQYVYVTFDAESTPMTVVELKEGNRTKYKYSYDDIDKTGNQIIDENGKNIKRYFTIDAVEDTVFSNSQPTQVNYNQIKSSNVYHWEQEGETELTVLVNSEGGEEYDPVYIILTGTTYGTGGKNGTGVTLSTGSGGTSTGEGEGTSIEEVKTQIKIKVTRSNQRPLVFCNLTKNEIEFSIGDTNNPNDAISFKGMIYSPFAKVVNQPVQLSGGSSVRHKFTGNIIAKELGIQDPSVDWSHKNFVADDGDLNKISDDEAAAQDARKQTALDETQKKFSELLHITLDDIKSVWNNSDWSGKFGDDTTDYIPKFREKWYEVRQYLWTNFGLDMPDWPWKRYAKPTDTEQHHYGISSNDIANTGEKLRIINYRTEYLVEPYINPFNNYSLTD